MSRHPGDRCRSPSWNCPFAALHQLCAPMLGGLPSLPQPQEQALAGGVRVDRRSRSRPVRRRAGGAQRAGRGRRRAAAGLPGRRRAVVGRASRQVLGFVARRLLAESVLLVFAVRRPADQGLLAGLPELAIDGLIRRGGRGPAQRRHPGPSRPAGARPDRRRDPRQPAGAARAGPTEQGRAGGRLRPSGRRSRARSTTGPLPPADQRAARSRPGS